MSVKLETPTAGLDGEAPHEHPMTLDLIETAPSSFPSPSLGSHEGALAIAGSALF
jgi:hypothetical protein